MTTLKLGAVLPQNDICNDLIAIRDFAQAAESLGYSHLALRDHVLAADITNRPNWSGLYYSETPVHEPLVLMGFLAGITTHIELVTSILILSQRQTVLVAKQAAEVDLLSRGRLRLGIGVGWNRIEYEGLGMNFTTRGTRIEEQIQVLRALWSGSTIRFTGKFHRLIEVGINPLPIQCPIPLWLGGHSEPVLRRIGNVGDGWFPSCAPDNVARNLVERLQVYTRRAGRDIEAIGIEAHISLTRVPETEWISYADAWQALGATHLQVGTRHAGYKSFQGHIDALGRFKRVIEGSKI